MTNVGDVCWIQIFVKVKKICFNIKMQKFFIFLLLSYLVGSIPAGWLYVKIFKKKDIRNLGSGNIGATNVYRVCGFLPACMVFAFDFLKGFLPVYFFSDILWQKIFIGILAIFGHNFSIFLKGKGGKGVATGTGVAVAIAPLPVLISLVIFIIVFSFSKIISLSSLISSLCFPASVFFLKKGKEVFIFSVIVCIFVFFSHRKNISRLLRGEEKKISKL
ncbi:MAG: glycerol-3-phosphate 1-O-acyltransferase PlsY [Elusimicrobia bacterium]|nr:glycerol-3-phosphate 1-O-acyltransferase PlsY [Elusimicrobiota bacterium]